MGTLTADQERLPEMCDHKLPTSCRLSSIPECCACADERAHSAAYRTYIDGIGYVLRGTRWQRYCWFCKEFWENRVQASGLGASETRIPQIPDQRAFLERWYEFHRGYRIVPTENGGEERIAVLGEDLRQVSPGQLPRTIQELRSGRERSEMEEREREEAQRHREADRSEHVGSGLSLEDELDQLFQAAESEEAQEQQRQAQPGLEPETGIAENSLNTNARHNSAHAQVMVPAPSRSREYQARRVVALHRELHRLRHSIERVVSGLRDLGENVPDHTEATTRLSELGRTLDRLDGTPSRAEADLAVESVNNLTTAIGSTNATTDRTLITLQARVDRARQYWEECRRSREQAVAELDRAEEECRASEVRLRQARTEQRTTESYMRVFGTREEMVAQGENYESPIGSMFERAQERFRVAEQVRREERNLRRVLEDEEARGEFLDEQTLNRLVDLQTQERDVWGLPRFAPRVMPASSLSVEEPRNRSGVDPPQNATDFSSDEVGIQEYYAQLRRDNWSQQPQGVPASQSTTESVSALANPATHAPVTVQLRSSQQSDVQQITGSTLYGGPPGHQLDEDPHANNDRGLDAAYVLSALAASPSLRAHAHGDPGVQYITELSQRLCNNDLNTTDVETIGSMMDNQEIIWACGLPAERNRRRRRRGEDVTFIHDAFELEEPDRITVHHVEIMAECFMRSSRVRSTSGLSPPDNLQMCYRLQRGARDANDRAVLSNMLGNNATVQIAMEVHSEWHAGESGNTSQGQQRQALEEERRAAARRGDHTRAELNSQRLAAERVAVAAGSIAMRTGPRTLFERMASRTEDGRELLQRLRDLESNPASPARRSTLRNFNASPSATDSEAESDDEGAGLDAKDTGRPEEPMSDEAMTVKLDCRICYVQLADTACLPCGHLSMCRWCSEQHSPTMPLDKTRPRRAAGCPVCRKGIRQKVRIFRAS